jgi:uncharacterized protein YcbX
MEEIAFMRVTRLSIYPIKATREVSLQRTDVRPRGLAGDRRWVVIDETGQFVHQRVSPQLAVVSTTLHSDGSISIEAPRMSRLRVSAPQGGVRQMVHVWNDVVDAALANDEAADWFSQLLGFRCNLAFMDERAQRPVAPQYGRDGDVVSFADALPLLLTTEASLADLNRRMEKPLPMSRFRPNVSIDGRQPWEEDEWKVLRIGDIEFEITHPCVRCVVTTVDQETGEKSRDGEPLKTLATFRRTADGVCFGQNLVPRGTGQISVGDKVEVVSR